MYSLMGIRKSDIRKETDKLKLETLGYRERTTPPAVESPVFAIASQNGGRKKKNKK